MRLDRALLLAAVLACWTAGRAASASGFECKTAVDCELLGECEQGVCKCQAGWTGPTCGQLKLLAAPSSGAWPTHRPIPPSKSGTGKGGEGALLPNSWGASVVKDKDVDGRDEYHMFVCTGCFDSATLLHEWGYQISHATSPNITGPYSFVDTAVPPTAFNPHLTRVPGDDNLFVLFYLHSPDTSHPRCLGNETAGSSFGRVPAPHWPSRIRSRETDVWQVRMASASRLSGPWEEREIEIVGDDGDKMNPSAHVHRNGSVLLAYTSLANATYSTIGFAVADGWNGTYRHVGKLGMPMPNVTAEDPFLWRDGLGRYHMLLHMWEWYGPFSGLHAFSEDGLTWHASKHIDNLGAYSTTVEWDDGSSTVFFRRERPEILFDDDGRMTHFVSALEYGADHPDHQYSFSLVQQIDMS